MERLGNLYRWRIAVCLIAVAGQLFEGSLLFGQAALASNGATAFAVADSTPAVKPSADANSSTVANWSVAAKPSVGANSATVAGSSVVANPSIDTNSSPVDNSSPGASESGASSITGSSLPTFTPEELKSFGEPIKLPDYEHGQEVLAHDANKSLNLGPLYLSTSVDMHSFRALREESSYDQSITLRDAINYVLDHGMAIKVSRESLNYQHMQTATAVGNFLPTFYMSYNLSQVNVFNLQTTSMARTFLTGISFPVFQGGGVVYSLLTQRYREIAWRNAYKATVNDVFLDVYTKYTNLLLQRVLLQTWAKTVESDQEQVRINEQAFLNGTGTRYAVVQSEALLANDRQSFLAQAVAMRQAGLTLNLALNFPLSINLIPAEETLSEAPIFNERLVLGSLLRDALKFQPSLRQYENFRLAAARNIQAQASVLYPSVQFFVLHQTNDTSVSPPANGFALGGAATTAIDSFLDSTFAGRVSNNALGQLYSFSPTAGSTSSQGANTGPSAMPAASGGTPIASIQSGSLVSSGAVAPSIFGGGNGSGSGPNANGSFQAPAGVFPGNFRELQAGFAMTWSLPSFGLQTTATLMASKALARQALMQCNQELSLVLQQVRGDYLSVLTARQVIDGAATAVAYYRETLRLAKVRLITGVGTTSDLIAAQKNYIAAFTSQAQAIVASNVAQAQLLHDMGMISATTLTSGYTPGYFVEPLPTGRRWGRP